MASLALKSWSFGYGANAVDVTNETRYHEGMNPSRNRQLFGLTPKEEKVLVGIVQGLTLNEIARRLKCNRRTVYRSIDSMSAKIGGNPQTAAAVVHGAIINNLVEIGERLGENGVIQMTPRCVARLTLGLPPDGIG